VIEQHPMNEQEKPKRAKRQFDEGFRRQAVALVETSGRPLREIATELGVSVWNLRDWKELYGRRSTPAQLEEQLERLRRELAEVRDQRDALKKVLGIVAAPSRNASPK
jgi:transposase